MRTLPVRLFFRTEIRTYGNINIKKRLIRFCDTDKSRTDKNKSEMTSFNSNENIHKKEGGSYYVVSANKASTVTLQSPGNKCQRKHTTILRISNRQSIQRLI